MKTERWIAQHQDGCWLGFYASKEAAERGVQRHKEKHGIHTSGKWTIMQGGPDGQASPRLEKGVAR